jgi:endoglucanase
MFVLTDFLKSLMSVPGLSGYEGPVKTLIEDSWETLTDEITISKLGSIHGTLIGNGLEPRPNLLISAHMDSIGLMVTGIIDGFLRVTSIGGIDHRALPGQLVSIHASRDIPAVVIQPPRHLLPPKIGNRPIPLEYLLVDTGLTASQVARIVRVGDLISFDQEPMELMGDTIAGSSLDNRASVASLTYALHSLQRRKHVWDVHVVASVLEEENLGGGLTSAYQLRPSAALIIDVTWARGPGVPDHKAYPLGKGITLGWGPNIHPGLHKAVKKIADQLEIPYKTEVMPRHSGTEAKAIQSAAEGIPTMTIGIPLRYMHTSIELVAFQDIKRAGRLIADFVTSLDADFMQNIEWDD